VRVETTSGVLLKANHGGKEEKPLSTEEAEKLAAAKNKLAEQLGLSVRYEVKDDE
jgi:hypothetical protein